MNVFFNCLLFVLIKNSPLPNVKYDLKPCFAVANLTVNQRELENTGKIYVRFSNYIEY